jgi:carboxymethylenebutenolidase
VGQRALPAFGLTSVCGLPQRADNAPVVLLTARGQSVSAWLRAVAIRAADQGYIAVVPDLLSGMAPNHGDSDSFPNDTSMATALERVGQQEIARRMETARK